MPGKEFWIAYYSKEYEDVHTLIERKEKAYYGHKSFSINSAWEEARNNAVTKLQAQIDLLNAANLRVFHMSLDDGTYLEPKDQTPANLALLKAIKDRSKEYNEEITPLLDKRKDLYNILKELRSN